MALKLYYQGTDREVQVGDEVELKTGKVNVVAFTPPHNPSSTGRVSVKGRRKGDFPREYFPSVIGAEWREVKE